MSEAGATAQQKREAQLLLEQQHDEIDRYADAVRTELENKSKLEERLKAMESRVLVGGENLVDKMSDLQKLAKETKAEIDVKRCAPLRRCCSAECVAALSLIQCHCYFGGSGRGHR